MGCACGCGAKAAPGEQLGGDALQAAAQEPHHSDRDEAQAESETREEQWVEFGGKDLEEPLRQEWVKLIRASWLVQLSESGGVLSRRQDLPEEAFIGLDELKAAGPHNPMMPLKWLRIIVVSYPWLQPGHPDPHGENLRAIAKALKLYVDWEGGSKPYGVLIDFGGLFQAERTGEEYRIFKLALGILHLFYSHPHTIVLKVTKFPEGYPNNAAFQYHLPEGANTVEYEHRGWCSTESAMSSLVKTSDKVLDLGKFQPADLLYQAIDTCKVGRAPPLHPGDFRAELDTKTFTNKKDDFEKVADLYSKAFHQLLGSAQNLEYHRLEWGPDEVRKLCGALCNNNTLRSLNLSNNRMGPEGAAALAKVLGTNASIQELDVCVNSVANEGAVAFAKALHRNNTVTQLNLAGNNIGPKGAATLAQALRVNTSILTLYVHDNAIGNDGAVAFAEALHGNRTLEFLVLMRCNIGSDGATALAEALHNNMIKRLDLGGNNIGPDGTAALAEALRGNHALEMLGLSANNIGTDGAAALAEALRNNATLQILALVTNAIGSEGAAALAEALRNNATLHFLHLAFNAIGPEGAAALAEALQTNTSLRLLDLQFNPIGDEAKVALQEAGGDRVAIDESEVGAAETTSN